MSSSFSSSSSLAARARGGAGHAGPGSKGPRRKPDGRAVRAQLQRRGVAVNGGASGHSRSGGGGGGNDGGDGSGAGRGRLRAQQQYSDQPARPSTVDIFGANSALFHAYEQIKKINHSADLQARKIDSSIQHEVAANLQRNTLRKPAFANTLHANNSDCDGPGGSGGGGESPRFPHPQQQQQQQQHRFGKHSPRRGGGGGGDAFGPGNDASSPARSPVKKLAPLGGGAPALPLHQAMDARGHEMRNIHFAADHLVQAYKYAALESNISTETIMRTNEELMKIAKAVQRTSICFHEVLSGLVGVPRYEAQVRVLSKIEKTFINLFEKILKNVTLLERARVRLHEEEWREKGLALERAKVLVPKLSQQITTLKQMLESQKATTRQHQERGAEQERTLDELHAQTRAQAETIQKLRGDGARSGHSLRLLSQSISNSGTTAGNIMKDMRLAETRKEKLIDQMSRSRDLLMAQQEQQDLLRQQMAARPPPPIAEEAADGDAAHAAVGEGDDWEEPETPTVEASTQTKVDEDGLWDVAEFTAFRQVTRVVPFRLWQRALRFVRCPRCRGRQTGPGGESLKDPTAMDLRPRPRKVGQWKLSAYLHRFLQNLPARVVARASDHAVKPFYPWLTMQIDYLLDDKLQADATDLADHSSLQSFPDYLCERYLIDRGSRQLAEVGVYELLNSMKKHLKQRTAKVQLLAHFLGVVESKDNNLYDFMTEQLLHVLNRARHQLRAPTPVPGARTAGPSSPPPPLLSSQPPGYYYEQNQFGDWTPLRHAIKIVRRTCAFLPFRKMIRFIRQLEAAALIRVTPRSGETVAGGGAAAAAAAPIYEPQSVLTRGCVRSAIRQAILDLGESVASYMGGGAGGDDDPGDDGSDGRGADKDGASVVDQTAVIDVFETLHVLVRIVALRRRPVEDRLRRLYIEADENRDGVLSFDEFKQLIEDVEAASTAEATGTRSNSDHASHEDAAGRGAAAAAKAADSQYNDRRIVRMYRQAQELSGSSGAISREGFIRICGKYGFIPFIDLGDDDDHHHDHNHGHGRGDDDDDDRGGNNNNDGRGEN